jgi:hypothetical protein
MAPEPAVEADIGVAGGDGDDLHIAHCWRW